MEYDEIVLTNAMKLAAFGFINDPDYDTQAFFDRNKSKLVFDGDDVIIRPQHRDGIYYNGEYTELSAMEQEITSILLYRVEMSDSGLLPGDHETKLGITAENNFVSDKFIPGQINKPVSVWSSDKVESHLRGAALIFDEGAFDGNEYEKALSFGWTQDGNAGRSYFNASGMSGVIFSTYYFTKVDQNGEQFSAVEGTEQITPYIHGGFHDLWYYEYTFDSECLCDNESRTPVLDSAEYDIQTGDTLKELTAKYGIPFIQYINVFTGEYSNIDFDSTGHNIKTVYYVSEDGKLFTVRLAPSDNGSQNDYTVYEVVITDIR